MRKRQRYMYLACVDKQRGLYLFRCRGSYRDAALIDRCRHKLLYYKISFFGVPYNHDTSHAIEEPYRLDLQAPEQSRYEDCKAYLVR